MNEQENKIMKAQKRKKEQTKQIKEQTNKMK